MEEDEAGLSWLGGGEDEREEKLFEESPMCVCVKAVAKVSTDQNLNDVERVEWTELLSW